MVYMTGNGQIACIYHEGDMVQVFGPPYSSPSLLESSFSVGEDVFRTPVRHLPGAGIWNLRLEQGGKTLAEITDFALPEEPCLVRRIESSAPVSMTVRPYGGKTELYHYETWTDDPGAAQGVLFKTKSGNAVYNDYPLPFAQFFVLLVRGDAAIEKKAPYTYDIRINGMAYILIIGGPSYPQCDEAVRRLSAVPYEEMLRLTADRWQREFDSVTVMDRVPETFPRRQELAAAVEDTVINLVVQQSREGGVLAGGPFPLGYVRDQFGVCMCMLRLGLYDRARRMLQFYIDVFRHSGYILNAQGLGVKGLFHFAENDKTEITGYLLLQFFRYAEVTGDDNLLRENIDFLYWLYAQQVSQLHHDMLPFNGDETYIAGGLLPRDVINEGSAEATMLFLLSGRKLLAFLESGVSFPCDLDAMRSILDNVEAAYEENFVLDGKYTLNNPRRLEGLREPEYRYGVCMNLGKEDCDFFGWTKRCGNGVYLCPKCLGRHDIPDRIRQYFYLPSALLMPAYVNSHLPGRKIVEDYLYQLTAKLRKDGYVYSDEEKKKNIGYDYGLLLYNLVRYDIAGKELAYNKILDLIDAAGTWAERYIEDQPDGARYRPWESSINVDAMLAYALSWKEHP